MASIRFDRALGQPERAAYARACADRDAHVRGWADVAGVTFALLDVADAYDRIELARELRAQIRDPAWLLLTIVPASTGACEPLRRGLGARAGVRLIDTSASDLTVAVDPSRTSLAQFVAWADEALGGTGRTIRPLLPIADASLTAFVSARIREPKLTASRVLDVYVERLQAVARR